MLWKLIMIFLVVRVWWWFSMGLLWFLFIMSVVIFVKWIIVMEWIGSGDMMVIRMLFGGKMDVKILFIIVMIIWVDWLKLIIKWVGWWMLFIIIERMECVIWWLMVWGYWFGFIIMLKNLRVCLMWWWIRWWFLVIRWVWGELFWW